MPRFSPGDLRRPLIQAPMAAGPSTPALAAAVGRAGALGFLAGGYLTADALAAQIAETRALPGGAEPFGVNLFVPQPVAEPHLIAAYREEIKRSESPRYRVDPGEPDLTDADHWAEKLQMLLDDPVPVVSFTFGVPEAEVVARLREQGSYTIGTVTSVDEARRAAGVGIDALCVQGPEAGGHRGTFDPAATPPTAPLPALLAEIRAVTDLPLIAAGGLATADHVAHIRGLGAALTQHGTAFLRADEAGTQPLHRDALTEFPETVVTRAFSGRWARALRNRFTDEHPAAPAAYPTVNHVTRPLRAAASRQSDPDGMSMYAGVNHRLATPGPASRILDALG